MDFDEWGNSSPKRQKLSDATYRNNLAYLNNLRTANTSYDQMQADRIAQNKAIGASISSRVKEMDQYWATQGEMTQPSLAGRTLAKAQNFAANALDTGTQMINQGMASFSFNDGMKNLSMVDEDIRLIYAKYKQNPFSVTEEEFKKLDSLPKQNSARSPLFNKTNLEHMQEYDSEMQDVRDWIGNVREGEKGRWGTEKYNPYFSDLRDAEVKKLNDAVSKDYKPRIEALEKAGKTGEAVKLAAEMNGQFLKNAAKANWENNDALIGEAGSMVPYLVGGILTAVGGAAGQTMEDYVHARDQYEKREGHVPVDGDAWKMAGVAGLNFGANFIENATPLAALKALKGTGKAGNRHNPIGPNPPPRSDMVGPPTQGRMALDNFLDTKTGKAVQQMGSWGKEGAIIGGHAAGAGLSNFTAGGIQDSIQRGWGSLDTDAVTSRSFIEAGVTEAMSAGAMMGGAQALSYGADGLAHAARYGSAGVDRLKSKIEDKLGSQQKSFDEYMTQENFNPEQAIKTQMQAFSKSGATPEEQTRAKENISSAVNAAEQAYAKAVKAQEDSLPEIEEKIAAIMPQHEENLRYLEQDKKSGDKEAIAQSEQALAGTQAYLDELTKARDTVTGEVTKYKSYLDSALKASGDFDTAARTTSGEANTPEAIKANVDTLTKASTPEGSPEVTKASEHMKKFPQIYKPEDILAAVDNPNSGFTQNERGLLRKLAEQQIGLNQLKDSNAVSKEIIKGGKEFRGLNEYQAKMSEAIRLGHARQQDRLLREMDNFHNSMSKKAEAVEMALQEATTAIQGGMSPRDAQLYVYKDTQNGEWLINRGEVDITPDNRDKYGAVFVNPAEPASVELVNTIRRDAGEVAKARDLLQEMRGVLANPQPQQGVDPQQSAPGNVDPAQQAMDDMAWDNPTSLSDQELIDQMFGLDNQGNDLNDPQPQITEPTPNVEGTEAQGPTVRKSSEGSTTKKTETGKDNALTTSTPKSSQKEPEQRLDPKDKETPKVEDKKPESEAKAKPEPRKDEGKLRILAEATKESLKEERSKGYNEQNLVRTGFTQSSKDGGAANPLVKVKDFITSFKQSNNKRALLAEFVGGSLTPQQIKLFDHFTKFNADFAKQFKDSFVFKRDWFAYENFTQFLATKNKDGSAEFDENVLTAAATSAYTWLAENGNRPNYRNADIANNIFHLNVDDKIPLKLSAEIFQDFNQSDSFASMASALGKRAVQALGLKVRDDVALDRQARLEASLGGYIIHALERQGLLEIQPVTNKQMLEYSKGLGQHRGKFLNEQIKLPSLLSSNEANWTDEQRKAVNKWATDKVFTKYVRLRRPHTIAGRPAHRSVVNMSDMTKGTGNFLSQLFGVTSSYRDPLTKKPKSFAQNSVKKTPQGVPTNHVEMLDKALKDPYRVRTEAFDPLVHARAENDAAFKEMLGLQNDEAYLRANFHVTEWENEQAKRDAVLRDMDLATDFVNESLQKTGGEYGQVWMPLRMWQPQRVGVDTTRLNPQGNQMHRTMVTPSDFRAEITIPKGTEGRLIDEGQIYDAEGNLTDVGQFLRAVAEHAEELKLDIPFQYVGSTVDKVHPSDFLPSFIDWINKPSTQEAIRAMSYLRKQSESKAPIDARTYKKIGNAISEMGMGVQSFAGLVALSEMYDGQQTGKGGKFVTYVRAGSDGKTNGSAYAMTLAGTVDASTGTNEMSEGFGLLTKESVAEGKVDQFVVAQKGQGDLYNAVNKFQMNRWSQLFSANTELNIDPTVKSVLTGLVPAMNSLFGDFDKRNKGKTIATPTVYGSGAEAIKQNAASENLRAIYKKMQSIATSDSSSDSKQLQVDALVKDINQLIDFHNAFLQQIPQGTWFNDGYKQWAARMEYDYNLRNPDAPLDHAAMSPVAFLQTITGKKDEGDTKKLWGSAVWRYNKDRDVTGVERLPEGVLKVDGILDVTLDPATESVINAVSYHVHGRVHEHALKDAYKDYVSTRDTNVAISQASFTVYSQLKRVLTAEAIEQGMNDGTVTYKVVDGKRVPIEGLSKKALENIEARLFMARPVVATASSAVSKDAVGTGIMLATRETQYFQDETAKVAINAKLADGTTMSTTTGFQVPADVDPGVRGSVLPILATDAAVSIETMGRSEFAVENMHDANYSNVLKVEEMGQTQNQAFHDFTATYHLQVEMLNMLMRGLNEVGKGSIKLDDAAINAIQDSLQDLKDRNPHPQGVTENNQQFLMRLVNERYAIEQRKLDYLDSLHTVQQYASAGTQVVLTDKDAKLREESRKKLEQSKKSEGLGRASRVGKELDALFGGKGKPRETTETRKLTATEAFLESKRDKAFPVGKLIGHVQGQLKSQGYRDLLASLEKLMPKGLMVNYFNDKAIPDHVDKKSAQESIDLGASGWYDPNTNTINILDHSSENGRVGTELLLHELLHAGLTGAVEMVNNGKGTPEMVKAVERLETMRQEIINQLKANNDKRFTEALRDVDELIAWGLSNKNFQDYLAKSVNTKRRQGWKVGSFFSNFVKSILDLALGIDKRAPNRGTISGFETLVREVAVLSEQMNLLDDKSQQADLLRAVKPMIAGKQTAHNQAVNMSPKEVYESLDGSGMSDDFSKHVSELMDSVVDRVLTRAGREHLRDGLTHNRPSARNSAKAAGFGMSEREAYAVEALEVAIDNALENGAGSRVMKALTQAYDEARKSLTVASFYDGDWANASAQDKAMAQARYNYVFKPTATGGRNILNARFAALALGNEKFSKLVDFKPTEAKEKKTTTFGKMMDAVDYALSWTNNWMAGTHKSDTVKSKVDALVNRMADIDYKARQKSAIAIEKAFDDAADFSEDISDRTRNALARLTPVDGLKNSKIPFVGAAATGASFALGDRADSLPKTLQDMRDHNNPNSRLGVLNESLNEFRSADGFMQGMKRLLSGTKEIEKLRANTKSAVKRNVRQGFAQKLTKEQHEGLAYGLLRTGAYTLLDSYSPEAIRNLVGQKAVRDRAIGKLQYKIMTEIPNGNAVINRAKQLGWFMQSGNPTPGLVLNALAIAQGVGSTNFKMLKEADPEIVKAIDELATLWSIDYMSDKHRKGALSVMTNELRRTDKMNGFDNMLKIHRQLSEDALATRFGDNPLSMIKGWVPEISSPYVKTRIAPTSDKAKMEAQGWELVSSIKQDAADPLQKEQSIYVIKDGGDQRRVSGILSLTDTHTKGLVITDGVSGEVTQTVNASLTHKVKQVELTDHAKYDPRKDHSTQLFANFDTDGKTMNYAYRMSARTRDDLLDRKHDVDKLLGEYAGTSLDKVRSPDQNRKTLAALYKDYAHNFMKEPNKYVEIGPKASDPGAQELWRLLPHHAREEMENLWGKGEAMWVRNDLVNMAFGYKKLAAGNIWNKGVAERNLAEKVYTTIMEAMFKDKAQLRAYQIGRGVTEVVATAKDWIVLRTLDVLWGNIKANMVLLAAIGVNPVRGTKDAMLAFKAGKAYQDDRKELLEVEYKLRAGIGNQSQLEVRLAQLQDSLARNPLIEFIEAGTMPAIVDDVEATFDDFGYKSYLQEKASKFTDPIPDNVKTVAQTLMLSPGTIGHNAMTAATQYSDFIGRYVVYKHYREREGMSHDDAIHEAMETFINYDLPSSPQVQWLNDTGIFMFTKFLFRYQRVLMRILRKNPAMVLAQSAALSMFTDIPSAMDPNLLNKGMGILNPGPVVLPSAILGSTPMSLVF